MMQIDFHRKLTRISVGLVVIALSIALNAPVSAQSGWTSDVRLTNDPNISKTSYSWARNIVEDTSGRVHALFHDDRTGYNQIYYRRSNNGGNSWNTQVRLSPTSISQETPSVATSGSNVYVVWHDFRNLNFDIYFKRSTNNGGNWQSDVRLTTNPNHSQFPSVASSGNNVYATWVDNRDGQNEVYFRASFDSGSTWRAEQRVSDLPFNSWTPTVTAAGSTVFVFWVETQDGNEEEYFKKSTDGGDTWGSAMRLTNDPADSWAPSAMAASASLVHLTWFDNREGYSSIYYKRSTDGGATWTADTRVSQNPVGFNTFRPTLALYGNDVYLTWVDSRDLNPEIYFLRSTNEGVSWGPEVRLTNAAGDSLFPHVGASLKYVHVLWHDGRNGNAEIYYKRLTK